MTIGGVPSAGYAFNSGLFGSLSKSIDNYKQKRDARREEERLKKEKLDNDTKLWNSYKAQQEGGYIDPSVSPIELAEFSKKMADYAYQNKKQDLDLATGALNNQLNEQQLSNALYQNSDVNRQRREKEADAKLALADEQLSAAKFANSDEARKHRRNLEALQEKQLGLANDVAQWNATSGLRQKERLFNSQMANEAMVRNLNQAKIDSIKAQQEQMGKMASLANGMGGLNPYNHQMMLDIAEGWKNYNNQISGIDRQIELANQNMDKESVAKLNAQKNAVIKDRDAYQKMHSQQLAQFMSLAMGQNADTSGAATTSLNPNEILGGMSQLPSAERAFSLNIDDNPLFFSDRMKGWADDVLNVFNSGGNDNRAVRSMQFALKSNQK